MGAHPAVVNYSMFCAAFAMLALFYLIPASLGDKYTFVAFLPLALDALLTIFWFCAAVALAAELGVHSCSRDVSTAYNLPRQIAPRQFANIMCTELRLHQPRHPKGQRPARRLPRSPSILRLPLVRLRCLRRLPRHLSHVWHGRKLATRRYSPRSGHEPGLNNTSTPATSHIPTIRRDISCHHKRLTIFVSRE